MTTVLQSSSLSLREVEHRFNLQYVEDPNFFTEYQVPEPVLSELDQHILDRAKQDFLKLRKDLAKEELVKMVLVSPLLSTAGLYRYPFHVEPEKSVELTVEGNDEVLRGRIDVLVLQDNLWVIVIEAKKAEFSIHKAVPQTLSYLMNNPNPTQVSFGLVTNGSELMFLKLQPSVEERTQPRYGFSRIFSLFNPGNELYEVVTILQRLGSLTS